MLVLISHYVIFTLITLDIVQCRRSRTRKPNDDFPDPGSDDSGLFIWRIEDFSPVPLRKTDYGKFHTGDSYIVLNSKGGGHLENPLKVLYSELKDPKILSMSLSK